MHLNKILKLLMSVMTMILITACSSHKSTNNDNKSIMDIADTGVNLNSKPSSTEEQILLQRQELQYNNIIYFDLDKYDISSESARVLDAHANFLRNNLSYIVTIEGHADERGTPEYNIALGERRANAVKMYLQSKGISASQLTVVSYGKEKPAVLGHDELAYAKNRRAILAY